MVINNGVLYSIDAYDIENGNLIIPNNVRAIADNAFKGILDIKSVEIPESVEAIGKHAFSHCDFLTKVHIPKSVKEISDSAFYNCRSLKEITLDDGIEKIGENTFARCPVVNVNIPDSVKDMGSGAFQGCILLKKVKLPKSIDKISAQAFENCRALTQIEIPENVTKLENNAFCECSNLKSIKLPENLSVISENALAGCNFSSIKLPEKLKVIDNAAFTQCSSLKKVIIPEGVERIGKNAFSNCLFLSTVDCPTTLKIIDDHAFSHCTFLANLDLKEGLEFIGENAFEKTYIKNLNIPSTVKEIKQYAFSSCPRLKNAQINGKINNIEANTFSLCDRLETIALPNSLKTIDESAFGDCAKLKTITIPFGVTEIGESAFIGCHKLENVEIPNSVKVIGESAFQECKSLGQISIPSSVETIKKSAFCDCSELENVEFSSGLKNIETKAFSNCTKLRNINLPNTLENIGEYAFIDCDFHKIVIPNSMKRYEKINDISYPYFKELENGCAFSRIELDEYAPMQQTSLDMSLLASHFEDRETLFREQNNESVLKFYNNFVTTLPYEEASNFIKNHNFTFFKILNKRVKFEKDSLCKFIYNIGGVSTPFEENGKTYDYAQKSVEFVRGLFNKKKCGIGLFSSVGLHMETKGFNKEFTDFFMENFDELNAEERNNHGFIAKCYNNFEEVQKTNTNNRGSQRQLKATVQKFKDYFNENKFDNITEETRDIAKTISPYFSDQFSFDNAVSIFEEKKANNIPDQILEVPVVDEPFKTIDEYSNEISKLQVNTLSNLVESSKNQFTFEWVSKNDPKNLILGKLCNCCAHLEGVGYGIVHASIVHPNMQTVIVKDKLSNDIIAKATLYINPDERYGIVNSFQVADRVTSDKYHDVYKKFMQAIKKFADEYNKENPTKTLKQINVGMGFNDLSGQLRSKNRRSLTLFVPVDFGKYGIKEHGQNYSGDSFFEQHIIWTPKKENTFANPDYNPYENS